MFYTRVIRSNYFLKYCKPHLALIWKKEDENINRIRIVSWHGGGLRICPFNYYYPFLVESLFTVSDRNNENIRILDTVKCVN